jgi:hypothetical protein
MAAAGFMQACLRPTGSSACAALVATLASKTEFESDTYRLSIEQWVGSGAAAAFKPLRARVVTA